MVLIVFVMIKLCLIMVLIVLVVIHKKKKMCLIMVLIVLVMIQKKKKKFIVLNFTRKYILYKMIHLSTHLYGILPMYSIELCSSMLHKFAVLSFFFV